MDMKDISNLIPIGWALVPVDPTDQMLEALEAFLIDEGFEADAVGEMKKACCWDVMLSGAPPLKLGEALKLMQERDALAAKCAELEAVLNDAHDQIYDQPILEDRIANALDKPPATCLAEVQARAVAEFAKELGVYDSSYDDQGYVEVPRYKIKEYIEQLRQQAGGCDE